MIHGVNDPTLILRITILFQLVSTQSQLITTSIRFQGSTILRLWNPRSNDLNRIRTNLERLTPHNYGTGPLRVRSSDDWPRRPRVSCLYALQIGAQCQRPSFPSFHRPSRLAVEESAATGFSCSRLLLFLPFTRVQFNNTKRGIQIPHIYLHCKIIQSLRLLLTLRQFNP